MAYDITSWAESEAELDAISLEDLGTELATNKAEELVLIAKIGTGTKSRRLIEEMTMEEAIDKAFLLMARLDLMCRQQDLNRHIGYRNGTPKGLKDNI